MGKHLCLGVILRCQICKNSVVLGHQNSLELCFVGWVALREGIACEAPELPCPLLAELCKGCTFKPQIATRVRSWV